MSDAKLKPETDHANVDHANVDEAVVDQANVDRQAVDKDDIARPEIVPRSPFVQSPVGLIRGDSDRLRTVDAMAGQHGVFGFDPQRLARAVASFDAAAAINGGGLNGSSFDGSPDASSTTDTSTATNVVAAALFEALVAISKPLGCNAAFAAASPTEALEWAIASVRSNQRYKIIALLHADHGRSGVGRTASGIADLRDHYGPLMAGFVHVSFADIDSADVDGSFDSAVDDNTAAILLPVVLDGDGGRPVATEVYEAAADICARRNLALIVDHTQVTIGATGQAFAPEVSAEFHADAILYSAGLFHGLAGSLVLCGDRMLGQQAGSADRHHHQRHRPPPARPLQRHIATETLLAIASELLLGGVAEMAESIALEIAELASRRGIIRDISPLGMSIGLSLDVTSEQWQRAAAKCGLAVSTAGDNAVRMQLPLKISESDRTELLRQLSETLSAVESISDDSGGV